MAGLTMDPIQPFFVLNSMDYYKKMLPGSPVAHFYEFNSKEHIRLDHGPVPDGSVDIIFSCDPESPRAEIAGSVVTGKPNVWDEGTSYFGVRFLPGALDHFSNISVMELVENTVDFSEVTKRSDVMEQICLGGDFASKINVFLTAFPDHLEDFQKVDNRTILVRSIIDEIYYSGGNITMEELEQHLLYSRRHLLRVFKEYMGMDIKRFCRIVRFQANIARINRGGRISLAPMSVEGGYYDQSHYQKDFKEFAMMTPGAYLKLINDARYHDHITLL